MPTIRQSPFALRVVQRKDGTAAIVYRRQADANSHDRLQRIGAVAPLAFTAAAPLLRESVRQSTNGKEGRILEAGKFYSLDVNWGPKLACFALLSAGLRDGERLLLAADHLRHADPDEAAWWLGMLTRPDNLRALRALRILTEAVL